MTDNNTNNDSSNSAQGKTVFPGKRRGRKGMFWAMLVVGGAVGIGSAVLIGGAHADGWEKAKYFEGGKHGRRAQAEMLLKTFDADKDGSITRAEIDQVTGQKLAAADVDSDKAVNLSEFESVWMDMTRTRMVDAFQRLDDDGDGQVTQVELDEMVSKMMSRMDRNDDGVINKDDRRRKFFDRDDDDDDDDRS